MYRANGSQKKLLDKISFLLPVFPIIFFFLHNINQFNELIFTSGVLILFIIYSSVSFFLFIGLKKLIKLSSTQSLFLSTLIITIFLFFGISQNLLFGLKQFHFLSNSFFLLFLSFAAIITVLYFIKKKKNHPVMANRFIVLLFLVLISYEIIILSVTMVRGNSVYAMAKEMTSPLLIEKKSSPEIKPDIYYIIFDSYTNLPTFKEFWNYDNDIYPFLSSKGFYTVDSAFSNYKYTPFSMSSIFNLQYIKGAEPYLYHNSSNFLIGQRTYKDNLLFSFLKKEKYQLSIFSLFENEDLLTGFGFLGVDKPSNWLRRQTMERVYMNPWIAGKIMKFFNWSDKLPYMIKESMKNFRDYNGLAVKHIFSDCEKNAKSDKIPPQFNYTHFMIPHDPYQVDKDGNFITSAQPSTNDMNGYLEQVKYCNKLMKEITECLQADTSRKKIIIFQGDHGYRYYNNTPVIKQYGALNAIYFYNKDYKGLSKKMSHINTYRIILNKFFRTELPILKDSIIGINK